MRLVITGARKFRHQSYVEEVLRKLFSISAEKIDMVYTGGAGGVDKFAYDYIERYIKPKYGMRIENILVKADWSYGNSGGNIRNEKMLHMACSYDGPGIRIHSPNNVLLLRFPGGDGTNHCVSSAEAKGIVVIDHTVVLSKFEECNTFDMVYNPLTGEVKKK